MFVNKGLQRLKGIFSSGVSDENTKCEFVQQDQMEIMQSKEINKMQTDGQIIFGLAAFVFINFRWKGKYFFYQNHIRYYVKMSLFFSMEYFLNDTSTSFY